MLSKFASWPSNLVMWSRPALSRNASPSTSASSLRQSRVDRSTRRPPASGHPSNSHVLTVRVGGSISRKVPRNEHSVPSSVTMTLVVVPLRRAGRPSSIPRHRSQLTSRRASIPACDTTGGKRRAPIRRARVAACSRRRLASSCVCPWLRRWTRARSPRPAVAAPRLDSCFALWVLGPGFPTGHLARLGCSPAEPCTSGKRLRRCVMALRRRRDKGGDRGSRPTYSGLGSRIEELLRLADEQRDEIITEARHEAAGIVDEARKQAEVNSWRMPGCKRARSLAALGRTQGQDRVQGSRPGYLPRSR